MSALSDAVAANMPRILTLDIETTPHHLVGYGLFDQNFSPKQILEPTRVMCWAAKWHDQKKVTFRAEWDGRDVMVRDIYDLLTEADIVVHYNGDRFDLPHLHREFLLAGLPPLAPARSVDLLKVARRRFKFASNKLDHVAYTLGVGRKVSHHGIELWLECLAGNQRSQGLMRRYNCNDVRLTEEVYDRLRPWIDNHPNVALWSGEERSCPNCGSMDVQPVGFARTAATTYTRYRCGACGAVMRDGSFKQRARMHPVK